MGIYDRDYTKSDNPVSLGSQGRSGRGGGRRQPPVWMENLPIRSFNTWLIIVNIAVFVIFNLFFNTPAAFVNLSWGKEYFKSTSAAAIARGETLVGVAPQPHPKTPGVLYLPIIDPKDITPEVGRLIFIEDRTGRPLGKEIGRDRISPRRIDDAVGLFSTGKAFLELQVWRVLTFQFLHANMTHLVMNMLGLFMFGSLVEQALGRKRYAAFYLVCGIFGGLTYLLLNFMGNVMLQIGGPVLPGLLFDDLYTPLVGASAGIFGVLLAAAFLAPDETVMVFFVLPMKLKHAVYTFVVISLASLILGSSNAGGEAAHIGGAIAGAFFIRRIHLLRDFFDILGPARGKKPTPPKHNPNLKLVKPAETDDAVDAILAKLARTGRASLSEQELATLEAHRAKLQGKQD